MSNFETKLAWDCHAEYFEYYAFECPESWLELSKEYFTQEHGKEECSKIDWDYIKSQLKTSIDWFLADSGEEIYAADPAYRSFYNLED
jgi:carbonic anhydrase